MIKFSVKTAGRRNWSCKTVVVGELVPCNQLSLLSKLKTYSISSELVFLSSRLQNPQSRNNSVRGYPLVVIGYFKPPMYALSCSWHCHWYVLEDTQTFKSNLFCICICLPFRISSFLTCLMVFGSFVSSILKVNLSLQIFICLSNIGFSYIHPRDGGWIT